MGDWPPTLRSIATSINAATSEARKALTEKNTSKVRTELRTIDGHARGVKSVADAIAKEQAEDAKFAAKRAKTAKAAAKKIATAAAAAVKAAATGRGRQGTKAR